MNISPNQENMGKKTAIASGRKYKMSVREMAVSGIRNLPKEYALEEAFANGEFKVPNH